MEIELERAAGLLDYLGRVAWSSGEDVVVTKAGQPYLKIVPHPEGTYSELRKKTRGIGADANQTWVAPDLPETSEEIIEAFEGKWANDFF